MRKDYEEKIEQGKEYVKEHKDGIKKVLLGAGLFGAGMIFGVKLYDKAVSVNVSKTGYKTMGRVLDAGASAMLDMIADNAPEALKVMDKEIGNKVIEMEKYYLMQPSVVSTIAKNSMKIKR